MFKSLNVLLDDRIKYRSQMLDRMTESGKACLASKIAEHFWVSDFGGDSVTVVTSHSSYATDIHFQQREILKQLNMEFASSGNRFKKLRVLVCVSTPAHIRPHDSRRLKF